MPLVNWSLFRGLSFIFRGVPYLELSLNCGSTVAFDPSRCGDGPPKTRAWYIHGARNAILFRYIYIYIQKNVGHLSWQKLAYHFLRVYIYIYIIYIYECIYIYIIYIFVQVLNSPSSSEIPVFFVWPSLEGY